MSPTTGELGVALTRRLSAGPGTTEGAATSKPSRGAADGGGSVGAKIYRGERKFVLYFRNNL